MTYLCHSPDEALGRKFGFVLSNKFMRSFQILANRFLPTSNQHDFHHCEKHTRTHLGQNMFSSLQTLHNHLRLLRDRQRDYDRMYIFPLEQRVQSILSRILVDVFQFGGDSIGRDEFFNR